MGDDSSLPPPATHNRLAVGFFEPALPRLDGLTRALGDDLNVNSGCLRERGQDAATKRHRIPPAPREVDEVMSDHHMHERGMLEWIEHDEVGRIVVPTTPLRIHGADPVDTVPSPKLGQHNREIYGDWLGLSAAEIAALEQDSVI